MQCLQAIREFSYKDSYNLVKNSEITKQNQPSEGYLSSLFKELSKKSSDIHSMKLPNERFSGFINKRSTINKSKNLHFFTLAFPRILMKIMKFSKNLFTD